MNTMILIVLLCCQKARLFLLFKDATHACLSVSSHTTAFWITPSRGSRPPWSELFYPLSFIPKSSLKKSKAKLRKISALTVSVMHSETTDGPDDKFTLHRYTVWTAEGEVWAEINSTTHITFSDCGASNEPIKKQKYYNSQFISDLYIWSQHLKRLSL